MGTVGVYASERKNLRFPFYEAYPIVKTKKSENNRIPHVQGVWIHLLFDVFALVVATLSAQFRGLDALTINAARRRVLVTARLLAHPGAQGVVEALPVPAVTPLAAIPVDTGPLWIFMGEHPPCDARIDDRKDSIDHRPHIELAVAPPRLGWRDQIFEKIPFGISKVCGVWIGIHPQSVLN